MAIAGSGLAEVTPPNGATLDTGSRSHLTATGVTVELPEIAGMDCGEMRRVLARLDIANYRGRGLIEEDHPDYPVFVYEDRLATALYFDCTLRATRVAGQSQVFTRGFGVE